MGEWSAGRPQRWKVIGRDLSYHGTTLATLAIGGHLKRRVGFEPWLTPLPKAPACYCLRCPLALRYPDCAVACADALEDVIEREGEDTIAAFVATPLRPFRMTAGTTASSLTIDLLPVTRPSAGL